MLFDGLVSLHESYFIKISNKVDTMKCLWNQITVSKADKKKFNEDSKKIIETEDPRKKKS